ncbi:MAG: hypothetical protein ACRC8Q_12115 [Aeromonas sp.]
MEDIARPRARAATLIACRALSAAQVHRSRMFHPGDLDVAFGCPTIEGSEGAGSGLTVAGRGLHRAPTPGTTFSRVSMADFTSASP